MSNPRDFEGQWVFDAEGDQLVGYDKPAVAGDKFEIFVLTGHDGVNIYQVLHMNDDRDTKEIATFIESDGGPPTNYVMFRDRNGTKHWFKRHMEVHGTNNGLLKPTATEMSPNPGATKIVWRCKR